MFVIVVPLVLTDSVDVAREIAETWVLNFGVPKLSGNAAGEKLSMPNDPEDISTFVY